MVEVMKIMDTSLKRSMCTLLHSVPRPCSRPPLTQASAGSSWTLMGKSGSVSCGVTAPFLLGPDAHKLLFLPSKCLFPLSCVSSGVSLWVLCTQGMFEPSECLWQVWGLTLNMISPLLLSFWGFSFALGPGVSPQSHCSTTQLPLQCPSSCWCFINDRLV